MNRLQRLTGILAAVGALALVVAGCSGVTPTLPSPDDGIVDDGLGRSTISTSSEGLLLPDGLGVGDFEVRINGEPVRVRQVIPSRAAGLSITFIFDTTGSMGGTIRGVKESIEAFASAFTGVDVYWSGMEYGDATPSDAPSPWDGGDRTEVRPTRDLDALLAWLEPLRATGGGDSPENPLKALMEAKNTWTWPSAAPRHFIVLIDIGAHERHTGIGRDGVPFSPYNGDEVLSAFRGWGVIHSVSPDYTSYWAPEADAAGVFPANVGPAVYVPWAGWDVRELADGGPPAHRTHGGTGGNWIQMPPGGRIDLDELGLAERILQSYTVLYERPHGLASGEVLITATYTEGGESKTTTFEIGEVTW